MLNSQFSVIFRYRLKDKIKGSIRSVGMVFLFLLSFSFLSFSASSTLESVVELETRIENFQNLTPKEKQNVLKEQNQLVKEQLHELEIQEANLRKQRNLMIIQSGDIEKQERKLTTLFERIGWQRTVTFLLVAVLVLGLAFAWYSYRSYEQKQHFLEQERFQKRLISEQNSILENQKNQIESILNGLQDSIKYALRIQNAVLPSGPQMSTKLPGDYFIFSKPKDIVSGDFHFVETKGDWTLIAVADCTGHGVPGAFVSLLFISLLNETIQSDHEWKANEILQKLRTRIISLLQQKDSFGESRDGMDISLLLINKKKKKAQWAGAINPLLLVSAADNKLIEIKADKQPVGIYPRMENFTNHEIDIAKGDLFYLYTDGYADQFGGVRGKKFMKRQLKTILLENAQSDLSTQKNQLADQLEKWMNDHDEKYEQVDDITVFGFRLD